MANRVAIFIDGAYLDHVLRDEFENVRINYRFFPKRLLVNPIFYGPTTTIAPLIKGTLQLPKKARDMGHSELSSLLWKGYQGTT